MLFSQSTPSTDSNHATPMQKFQNFSENQILYVKPYPNLTNQTHKINSTHFANSECTFISNKPKCNDIFQFSNYAPNTKYLYQKDPTLYDKCFYFEYNPNSNIINSIQYFNLSLKKLETQNLSFADKIKLNIVEDPVIPEKDENWYRFSSDNNSTNT